MDENKFNSLTYQDKRLPHHYMAVVDPLGRSYVMDPNGKICWSSPELIQLDVCCTGAFAYRR